MSHGVFVFHDFCKPLAYFANVQFGIISCFVIGGNGTAICSGP